MNSGLDFFMQFIVRTTEFAFFGRYSIIAILLFKVFSCSFVWGEGGVLATLPVFRPIF